MSRSRPSTRQAGSAFTLIELLVVVAIIAVLASLLLSSLRIVKSSATAAHCSSNLRQMATAAFGYAGDSDGLLPMIRECGSYPNNVGWEPKLLEYLDGAVKAQTCPSRPAYLATWLNGYGMNHLINNTVCPCTSPWGVPGFCYGGPRPLSRISRGASNAIFADASNFYVGSPYGTSFDFTRHTGGGALIAYADGHTAPLSRAQFQLNPMSTFQP